MKKKTMSILLCLLASVMVLASCGAPQAKDTASAGTAPTSSADNKLVAEIDGQKFYYSDLNKWYNLIGSDSEDSKTLLDDFINYEVELIELKAKGYLNLTAEEITKAEQDAESALSSYAGYYGISEDQLLSDMGLTKDEIVGSYKFHTAETNAKTAIIGSINPTEDQIKAEYDANVANDKASMDADPTVYIDNINSGATAYYVPAGIRVIKRILIPIDENTLGAIQTLRDSGYDDQAAKLLEWALEKIESDAKKVAGDIKSKKTTFDAALAQYTDANMPDEGYIVSAGFTDLGANFTGNAMALLNPGSISDLFSTDDGYQIIQYAADKPQGAVSYDDVKDEIITSLQPELENKAWSDQIQQWKTGHNIVPYYDAIPTPEPTPTPETTETTESAGTSASPDESGSPAP